MTGHQTPTIRNVFAEAQNLPESERADYIANARAAANAPSNASGMLTPSFSVGVSPLEGGGSKVVIELGTPAIFLFDDPGRQGAQDAAAGIRRTRLQHEKDHATIRQDFFNQSPALISAVSEAGITGRERAGKELALRAFAAVERAYGLVQAQYVDRTRLQR